MNYTNDTEQIVFIKDGDIVASLDGKTLSGNSVELNGVPSFDLLSTVHQELSAYASSISANVDELSGTVGHLIARDKKDVSYLGEVELKETYSDPEDEATVLANTLYGLLLTNKNERDRALHTGFMFKAVAENHLCSFSITDGTNTQLFRDNDYLIVTNEVDAIKNVALSDITVIKDYDLSVYLIQNQIDSINLSIDGLDKDIAFLSSDLSATIVTRVLGSTDTRTIDEIIAEDYSSVAWNTGDIFIVKKHVYNLADEDVAGTEMEDIYEYTAYVFDKNSESWKAMDGNYSAENVYLTKDYTLDGDYTSVGNFLKSSKKIESKGKTLHWLLENMFDTTILPKLGTGPSFNITLTNAGTYEVGETVTPKYTLSYTQGKYIYSWNNTTPNDGTTLYQADVSYGSTTDAKTGPVTAASFSQSYKLTNGQTIKLTASNVKYRQGDTPVDSKGTQHEEIRRPGGDLTPPDKTTTNSIVGKYRYFYNQSAFPTKIDGSGNPYIDGNDVASADVRALLSTKVYDITAGTTKVNTSVGMTQFAIACPKASGITSIVVSQASPPIDLAMKKTDIVVKDGGNDNTNYVLFYIANAASASNANTYTVKQIVK